MKKTLLTLLFAGAVMAAPLAALADRHDWDHSHWDAWARAHRDVAVEVQTHPEYLRDRVWLGRHHDVQVYLQSDPYVVQNYVVNPYPIVEVPHHDGEHWHRYDDRHWGY